MSAQTPRIRRTDPQAPGTGPPPCWTRRPKDRPRRRTGACRRMVRARPEELAKGRCGNPRRGEMGGAEGHGLSRAESHADVLQDAIVYGSKARGDWNDDSDIDVLVHRGRRRRRALQGAQQSRLRPEVTADARPATGRRRRRWASPRRRLRPRPTAGRGRAAVGPSRPALRLRMFVVEGGEHYGNRRADDRHAPVSRGSGRRRRRRDERGHRAVPRHAVRRDQTALHKGRVLYGRAGTGNDRATAENQ